MTSLSLVERALNEQFQAEALETKPQDDDNKNWALEPKLQAVS